MVRRAEQHRLLLQQRSGLAVLQHAIGDVASLIGFIANVDESRSDTGVPVAPQVLGEALSGQIDYTICGRQD